MWFPRDIAALLLHSARTRPAVVLTGPRQVGKSSLLRSLFPEHTYVTLDAVPDAALAERDPEAFLDRYPAPLIVDEIQYAPGLLRHLKLRIDADRAAVGRYLLSGSQSFARMNGVSESLAGRVALLNLEGLSRAEIAAGGVRADVWTQVWKGGFPELWAHPEVDAAEFLNSYVATYLERDVRNLLRVGNLRDFDRFLRACALRSAQILNRSDLARDVGISPSTAGEWLSVLEASRQVVLLEPWFSNRTRSIVKSPKLYLADTGLLCALLRISSPAQVPLHPYAGAIWETYVVSELRRTLSNRSPASRLHFWSDRRRDVDLVLEQDGALRAWDAKLHALPDDGDTAQLRYFREQVGADAVRSLAVVTPGERSFPLAGGVDAVGADRAWIDDLR
jgi:predicted AAA+ superfamily ATPase